MVMIKDVNSNTSSIMVDGDEENTSHELNQDYNETKNNQTGQNKEIIELMKFKIFLCKC